MVDADQTQQPGSGELRIAPLDRAHLPRVVDLHARAFPDAAITQFGGEVIRRYYAWLMDGPHDAAIMGAWRDDALVGFCAAGVFRGAMNGFLRANRAYLVGRVLRHPSLLRNSLILSRLSTALKITLRFSRFGRALAARPAAGRAFGVLSIATDPLVWSGGIGRALMHDAESRARRLGFDRMTLSVSPHNIRAIRFYEQLGWTRVLDDGAWNGTMVQALV